NLLAHQQMWISHRGAISSPILSTCRAEKRFYTASAESCQWQVIVSSVNGSLTFASDAMS
ncbi:hypothetical protein, partial [Pseudomonas prosekii]